MNKDHFLSKIIPEPNSGCWLWEGSTFQPLGRGKEYGRYGKHSRLAHRLSFAIHKGDPGEGMVCHSCDNTFCVNPDHLFLGDASTNASDKVRKGRQARGDAIRPTKLTQERARHIKEHTEQSISELAYFMGVSYGVVWNVRNGHTWKWA